jgi:hypothetical protein
MTRLGKTHVALILSVAAVAAAGCGSSSSSKSTAANTPAPSTPATPSTPGTSSTATTANVGPSTPITDPAIRKAIIAGEKQAAVGTHATQTQLNDLADCVIKKYEAAGVKTLGELDAHKTEAKQFGAQCATELHIQIK